MRDQEVVSGPGSDLKLLREGDCCLKRPRLARLHHDDIGWKVAERPFKLLGGVFQWWEGPAVHRNDPFRSRASCVWYSLPSKNKA